jgi:hypothetical protein
MNSHSDGPQGGSAVAISRRVSETVAGLCLHGVGANAPCGPKATAKTSGFGSRGAFERELERRTLQGGLGSHFATGCPLGRKNRPECPFFALSECLTKFQHSAARVLPSGPLEDRVSSVYPVFHRSMRITLLPLLLLSLLATSPARADLRITRDHGGYVTEYKAKYERIRDRKERVIIDGICNSACTMVFGIVPMNKVCVTPRASLGFHQAYYDKAFTFGIKVNSSEGTSDLMSYYPRPVKDWISRNGGLTNEMKKIKNGTDMWKIVDPCPEEF